jgi:NADH:ubiquinone oxidoreductase subunit F (NADH-binding)
MASDLHIQDLPQMRFKPPYYMAERVDVYPFFCVSAVSAVSLAEAVEHQRILPEKREKDVGQKFLPKIFSIKYTHSRFGSVLEVADGSLLGEILKSTLIPSQLNLLKAIAVGGAAGVVLTPEQAKAVPLTYHAEDCGLPIFANGTILLMDKKDCAVDFLATIYECYRRGSCGICMPCREGTIWLSEIAGQILRGKSNLKDFDIISPLSHHLRSQCLCSFPDTLQEVTDSVLKLFSEEFIYHINYGICDVIGQAT